MPLKTNQYFFMLPFEVMSSSSLRGQSLSTADDDDDAPERTFPSSLQYVM